MKISEYCEGEKCHCGKPAMKKISEVILPDEEQTRHELTQYVCQEHFDRALKPYLFKDDKNIHAMLNSNDIPSIDDLNSLFIRKKKFIKTIIWEDKSKK